MNHLEKNKIDMSILKEDRRQFIKNNQLILKTQQRFRSEKHVSTEEINKISLSSSFDERIQSIDSMDTYAYGTSKDLIIKKKEIKCNIVIKQYKK